KSQIGAQAGLAGKGVNLRHIHIYAQRLLGGHMEEFLCSARVNQLPYIDATRGHYTIKWRIDFSKETSCSSRCTFACADLTCVLDAIAWVVKFSVSCWETACDLTRS